MSNLAALDNLTPEWHKILEKLGLDVVLVTLDARLASPLHQHPDLEKSLGLELQAAKAGRYDSTFYHKETRWVFFHCHNLGAAMSQLKQQLGIRGLLGIANIIHAEESDTIRAWWSYEPEQIGKEFVFES